jgi:deoxycytidylate deaminase
MGVSLDKCKMYTNGVPCMDCARGIVQSGIKEIIVDEEWGKDNSKKWDEHSKKSLQMFREVGVNLRYHKADFIELYKLHNGKRIPLK